MLYYIINVAAEETDALPLKVDFTQSLDIIWSQI